MGGSSAAVVDGSSTAVVDGCSAAPVEGSSTAAVDGSAGAVVAVDNSGAASGMGFATAHLLLARGARVAMSDINPTTLQKAHSSILPSTGINDAWKISEIIYVTQHPESTEHMLLCNGAYGRYTPFIHALSNVSAPSSR